MVLLLKNKLCTLSQRLEFHAMPVFTCNVLQGASITELFQVFLAVCQTLREGTVLQMFCWYAREKQGSQFSLVPCEDCCQVFFEGLVGERICVWCLVIVVIVLILYSYFFWIFLTECISITIYNKLKYLSCIKVAYNN